MQKDEQHLCDDSVPTAEDEESPIETLPSSFVVNIRGWENDEEGEAREFAKGVFSLAKTLSCYLDLSRLESIVIGWDYSEALLSVDRGDGIPPSAPTENEYGQGGAMAVSVIRDDEIWNVVVIWTGLVRQLNQTDHPEYELALQTFVHELVHVDDLRLFTRTYPGGWRAAKPRDGRDANLQPIVNPCQSEYSAQRRAAWAAPEHGLVLLDMMGKAMKEVDDQIGSARLSYRIHGDLEKYWSIVIERLSFLFQAIGYGLGHADWIEENAHEHPKLATCCRAKLDNLASYPSGWLLDACRDAVQPFFRLEEWKDQEVYNPLIEVLERLLNQNGMYTRAQGDGIYIDIPYTGL
ncbi:MAG: hypothetical protein KZQ93_05775 [Candidatus Thiodiazotropha sp. (ex Monitilora ramsayi)]|nr:hypothetical protein [Candidatus Thiodiazotropha sp. (ex Monitilora ramsayi)]